MSGSTVILNKYISTPTVNKGLQPLVTESVLDLRHHLKQFLDTTSRLTL